MNTLELQINNSELLPIKENLRVASFAFVQTEKDIEKATNFFNYMASTIENDFDFGFLDTNIEDKDLEGLKEGLVDTDIFIFSFFYKSRSYQNEIGNAGKLIEIISKNNTNGHFCKKNNHPFASSSGHSGYSTNILHK
jgi:hypothetical protein